jgi:hypothetical protein
MSFTSERKDFQKSLDSILREKGLDGEYIALIGNPYYMPQEWRKLEKLTDEHIFKYTDSLIDEWKKFKGDWKNFSSHCHRQQCGLIDGLLLFKFKEVLENHKNNHPEFYNTNNGGRRKIKRKSRSKRDFGSVKHRPGSRRKRSYKKRRITKK